MTFTTTIRIQLLLVTIFTLIISTHCDPRRICELDTENKNNIFEVSLDEGHNILEKFNLKWCTHLLIDRAHVNFKADLIFKNDRFDKILQEVNNRKNNDNRDLKIYLSLELDSALYAIYANIPKKTQQLAEKIADFSKLYTIAGINLKFTEASQVSENSSSFLSSLKESLNNKQALLYVSLDIPVEILHDQTHYNLSSFSYYTGFFIVRSYNFYKDLYGLASFNAPLNSYKVAWIQRPSLTDFIDLLDKDKIPRERVVFSIPVDAISFSVETYIYWPYKAIIVSGSDTKSLTRTQLCNELHLKKLKYGFDSLARQSFSYTTSGHPPYDFITYEDLQSLEWKIIYLINQNLGGILIHSINLDNRDNVEGTDCNIPFTFHNLVNEILETMNEASLNKSPNK